ncbi:MAG: HD domain-containing protein [Desulfobacterales bacterium]|nr:MAG: HD domain-containing protein [Desulfobacterales bacterium]
MSLTAISVTDTHRMFPDTETIWINLYPAKASQAAPDDPDAEARLRAAIKIALDFNDQYTRAHAQRVGMYAARLARRAGLPLTAVENIRMGGLLHDIGKVALDARILHNTNAELSEDMRAKVRAHPQIGVAILKSLTIDTAVIDCVYYHHERLDGSGYPCGLTADNIPLGAKIISVVDCFDAITTDRPYQKGRHPQDALKILAQMSGKSLCPELVEVFCEDFRQNGLIAGLQDSLPPFPHGTEGLYFPNRQTRAESRLARSGL